VAILFLGIFATMMPALDWLHMNAGSLGRPTPAFFYWSSGSLSSILDNAPTYLSFLSVLKGSARHDGLPLLAISIGSVFFGANTYIGNGPNFMVRAIAHQNRVAHIPTFLGYIGKYTLPFMLPMLALVWLLFFL
jgi:Na+/H+ antiporter NhaD/arsenite permease-like protein